MQKKIINQENEINLLLKNEAQNQLDKKGFDSKLKYLEK